jgi:hypothetical protein
MAKAFANGGSSLTGIEAVSNAVSALRPPEGRNARQLLATQGTLVAVLIAGISWLAHVTHAIPYTAGFPTVAVRHARLRVQREQPVPGDRAVEHGQSPPGRGEITADHHPRGTGQRAQRGR